ncbi:deoxynucleoside kinase [Candidatus Woesearchaeota archaeon]|nr:deoxynucleoside kinase [Candidatus Woesearchaeota archaeon]
MAKCVILIAGNICAGKTEFCKYVSQHRNVFSSAMNKWKEEDKRVVVVPEFIDPIALKLFYRDRKGNSALFEESCLTGRITRHLDTKYDTGIYLFDRGMIEGAETFSKNSYQEGYLSHETYESYIRKLKWGLDQLDRTKQESWLEQLVVYLRVDNPKLLLERQSQRKTEGEVIPLEYFQRINDRYAEFFGNIHQVYFNYGVKAPRVIQIDASVDFNKDQGYHSRVLEEISGKIVEDLNGSRTG